MKLVNLEKAETEEQPMAAPMPAEPEGPRYPWWSCLHIDTDELEALGIKTVPPIGTKFTISGVAYVKGRSEHEREGGKKSICMDLQITDFGLEKQGKSGVEVAQSVYPNQGKE